MSQIIFPINHLPHVIDVGKQTEQGVKRIGFDVHEWLDNWPGMKFSVQPTRPGESASYAAETDLVGTVLFWLIGAADTEIPGGGTVEIVGVGDGERKLSATCRTVINATTTDVTTEIPEPGRPWLDQVIAAGESAKADAKAAQESAQEAAQAASDAGKYSANADAQAAAAEQSAASAGASAASAERAKQEAEQSASAAKAAKEDAAYYATNAGQNAAKTDIDAKNAELFAGEAVTSATAASDSAKASAQSAAEAAESVKDIFIVKADGDGSADKTYEEISAAIAAGKVCMLRNTKSHRTMFYRETDANGVLYFRDMDYTGALTGSYCYIGRVNPDNTVTFGFNNPVRTPTPRKIKFTGAAEAEFDGTKEVTIDIPTGGDGGAGLPEVSEPYMQLVTDADGKVVWDKRTDIQIILTETALEWRIDGNNDVTYALTSPPDAMPAHGSTCIVTYNGVDYECEAADVGLLQGNEAMGVMTLGNFSYAGEEGGNPDAPFLLMFAGELLSENTYGVCVVGDSADAVTMSIIGIGVQGTQGADGGYYTPVTDQTSETTMQVSFLPSKADMPAVDPVDITLPQGPAGQDGKDGQDGLPGTVGPEGPAGQNGADGVSATHRWDGTTLIVTSASGTSSADLKGDTGETGPQGPAGADGATAEQVIAALTKETWTFTLADGTTVDKVVPLV